MFYNIQGLRAIAVISVIFFHYQVSYFDGGFLGVDIFFVISGYLMTLILDKKIDLDNILTFYLKRARRLLPALLIVIVFSLISGFLLMSGESFERLGKTSLASIFFVSNFFFWREWGYFDLYSLNKPLLHTWSLSLEMQFYFLFPLLLVLINLFIKKIKIIYKLSFLFIIFIIFTELFLESKSVATFYLLPFRISEFLLGAIGYHFEKQNKSKLFHNNQFFLACFAILVFFIFYYDKEIRFPGLSTVIPCLVTMLLILNKKSYLSKIIFENKFTLFIGNISYSLFLVHWPVFVFFRFYKFNEPSSLEKIYLLIVSIILAYFLNRYVENYFKKNISIKNNYKFIFSFLIVFIFSISVISNNGFNFRIKDNIEEKVKIENWNFNFFKDLDKKNFFYKKCIINSNKKNFDFILFGDSHAHMYANAFVNYSKKNNKNFCLVDLIVECNFFQDQNHISFIESDCKKRRKIVIDYLSKENFSNLIISHAWFTLNDNQLNQFNVRYENFYKKIFRDQKKNIIFLLSVPEFTNGISMEQCSKFPKYIIKKRDCYSAPKNSAKIVRNEKINKKIETKISEMITGNVNLLNPYDFLCDSTKCKQVINGYDVYIDDDHLSLYSSNLLLKFWEDRLTDYIK